MHSNIEPHGNFLSIPGSRAVHTSTGQSRQRVAQRISCSSVALAVLVIGGFPRLSETCSGPAREPMPLWSTMSRSDLVLFAPIASCPGAERDRERGLDEPAPAGVDIGDLVGARACQ